jgi:hypothetical protein
MSLAAPRRRSAIVLIVACLCLPTLATSTHAHTQKASPTPLGGALWQPYPLRQTRRADADGTAVHAAPRRGALRVQVMTTTPATSSAPVAPWLVVALIVVVTVALVVRARRGRRRSARMLAGLVDSLNPAARLAVARGGLARVSRRAVDDREPVRLWQAKGNDPEPEPKRRSAPAGTGGRGAPTPPDRGRAWLAEVEWRHAEGMARFQVLAADAEGTTVTIAESAPLDWPPSGPESVQAMSRAADALEPAMLAAGWKPLPPGDAWYAKRFAWPRGAPRRAPVAASAVPGPGPAPPAVTADDEAFELGERLRFARVPWPEGAEQLWRCEIRWRGGYLRSRFEAVALEPRRRRGQPIGGSARFKWMIMADPTPQEFQSAVDELTDSLASAGWERIADGAAWYSRRFVWHRDSPPGRLDAGQGSAQEVRQ